MNDEERDAYKMYCTLTFRIVLARRELERLERKLMDAGTDRREYRISKMISSVKDRIDMLEKMRDEYEFANKLHVKVWRDKNEK